MPLPLMLLGGAALVSAAYGAKKGYDAKQDFESAERIRRHAREIYNEAADELQSARDDSEGALADLGKTKFSIYSHSIIPFVELFSQIKDLDTGSVKGEFNESLTPQELRQLNHIQQMALEMSDVVGGGVAALGAGGLAGLAVYGGVGALGAASTGTAIGTLGGVAATNATLAWLGGGSIAAGGMGIAGGMAVLGGIAAGPVLAVGGLIAASKAEAARENALSTRDLAELEAEKMLLATTATRGIEARIKELGQVLIQLQDKFSPLLSGLDRLISVERDQLRRLADSQSEQATTISQKLEKEINEYIEANQSFWNRFRFFFLGNPYKQAIKNTFNAFCSFAQSEECARLIGEEVHFSGRNHVMPYKHFVVDVTSKIETATADIEQRKISFDDLRQEDQIGLHMLFSLAQTINSVLEAQIFDQDGILTPESRVAVEAGSNALAIPAPQNLVGA